MFGIVLPTALLAWSAFMVLKHLALVVRMAGKWWLCCKQLTHAACPTSFLMPTCKLPWLQCTISMHHPHPDRYSHLPCCSCRFAGVLCSWSLVLQLAVTLQARRKTAGSSSM